MTIRICDVCLKVPPGTALESFAAHGRHFDVCSACQGSPFRVPQPAHATVLLRPGTGLEVFVQNMPDGTAP